MKRAVPTGRTRNYSHKMRKAFTPDMARAEIVQRAVIVQGIWHKAETESVRETSVSIKDTLLQERAESMVDAVISAMPIDRHISFYQLDRDQMVKDAKEVITYHALNYTQRDFVELALPSELRKIILRYANADRIDGIVIAYLLATEYGSTEEMEEQELDAHSAMEEEIAMLENEYDGTKENPFAFYFKKQIGENSKHMKVWKKGIAPTFH